MTAPPGATPTTDTATSPSIESRTERFLSPRIVAREAAKILTARGEEVRPAALRSLVRRFIELGHTTTRELEVYLLHYADPVGEEAVRNVMNSGNTHPRERHI